MPPERTLRPPTGSSIRAAWATRRAVVSVTMKATATPALDRTMELAEGRTLAFSEWGVLDGRPIVLLHGTPGSRLMCPDIDATEAAGVRLITIDRPGYGRSDPRPEQTLLTWVDDFIELADHLDLPACPIVGWSGGGLYALASAYRLPERVTTIALAGSPGLTGEVPGALEELSSEGRALIELLHRDHAAGAAAIARHCQDYNGEGLFLPFKFRALPHTRRTERNRFMLSSGDADDQVAEGPGIAGAIQTWLAEGARQGSAGFVQDWVNRVDREGFGVADIRQDVHVWIGEEDRRISRFHADYLVATIPRARLYPLPGEGHRFLFAHWGDVLAALA